MKANNNHLLRIIRIVLATFFFVAVTLLFLGAWGVNLWFGWVAKVQFLPALMALDFGILVVLIILTLLFGRTPFSLLIKKMNEHLEEVSTVLMIDFLASVIVLVLCGTFLDMKSFMGFSTVMALFMRIVAHMSILKPELEWRWAVSKKETL